ncbi:hypothetical protein [Flavobacterium sp. W20_MBD1_R3]|uniref:hypothetical protein n=1 Tax=Flavobacterium sp. W20_MBD1_R3 TaxID=3240278 RepID=UPI003F932F90
MKTKILSGIACVLLGFFSSCDSNNNDENEPNPTLSLTSEDVSIESKIDVAIDDVVFIVEDQYSAQQNSPNKSISTLKGFLPTCAAITTVLADGVWTRTIDFGTEGCLLPNGNIVKGKIIITFSSNFTSPVRTISYTFIDFYHNNKLLQGNKTIAYELKSTTLLTEVHPVMTFSVDMKITFDDGRIYARTGTKTKETVEGYGTPLIWDDNVFLVTGNSTTVLPDGEVIAKNITTPLRYVMSCNLPFPVSGIVSITKNDSEGILNFGNGTCDNLASLTINGITTEIVLQK